MFRDLGWPNEQIEAVEDDLGVTGAHAGFRTGFAHLLNQMRAGVVGAVSVLDINRLGRNMTDFAAFVDAAQRQDVLLFHGDQVLTFSDPNGAFLALILGANATRENQTRAEMSKRARRKKAESGHASTPPPRGYISAGHGQWTKDPDPRVRDAISLIFDLFQRLGSGYAVVRALRTSGVSLPDRRAGAHTAWRPPTPHGVYRILIHPAYKGAYIYGKQKSDGTISPKGRRGAVEQPAHEWVYVEHHHDPYVTPEIWAQIQEQLRANRSINRGPAGRGDALLQGILKCTVHRRSYFTAYSYRERQRDGTLKRIPEYRCTEGPFTGFARLCSAVRAKLLDGFIRRELLAALTPPSVDAIERAAREALREHDVLLAARADDVRRSEHAASEAERALDQIELDQPLLRKRFRERSETALRELKTLKTSHQLRNCNEITDSFHCFTGRIV